MSNKGLITTGSVVAGGIVVAAIWSISASGGSAGTTNPSQANAPESIKLQNPVARAPSAVGFNYLEVASSGDGPRSSQDFRARFEQMRKDWDLDGDGELSREERQLMFEAMQAERAAARLARYDTNGDGVLDEEEERAARLAELLSSERGQALAREFDLNNDGVLDADEIAAMEASIEADRQRRRDERAQRAIDKYDLDGNGELDDLEREIAREARREQMQEFRDRMMDQYDVDGDGEMSADERMAAGETMRSLFDQRRYVNNNDANGDGVVDSLDMPDFIDRFTNNDPSADLNGDGVFDSADLDEFNRRMDEGENTMPSDDELPPMDGFRGGGLGGVGGGSGGGGGGGGGHWGGGGDSDRKGGGGGDGGG